MNLINYLNSLPTWLIVVVSVWSLIWKGKALWKASKNNQKYWFVTILVVNTLGILEIVYLLFFKKKISEKK